jgi:hypothetical protein
MPTAEQEAGRVTYLAEVNDHDIVFGGLHDGLKYLRASRPTVAVPLPGDHRLVARKLAQQPGGEHPGLDFDAATLVEPTSVSLTSKP